MQSEIAEFGEMGENTELSSQVLMRALLTANGKSTEKYPKVTALMLPLKLKPFELNMQQTTCASPLCFLLAQRRNCSSVTTDFHFAQAFGVVCVCAENWKLFAVHILDRLTSAIAARLAKRRGMR